MNPRIFETITVAILLPLVVLGNGCFLKYERNVSKKPTIVLATALHSSLCSIENDTFFARNEVNSTIRGLNYDSRSPLKFLYLTSNFARDDTRLNLISNVSNTAEKGVFRLNYIDDFPENREVVDMTYDWVSKNAYLNLRDSVMAVNFEISSSVVKILSNAGYILSLAVHPNAGYLFYVAAEISYGDGEPRVKSTIYRAHLDGSNATALLTTRDYAISLAIDFYEDRLYWAVPSRSLIQHSKLDGSDARTVGGRKVRFNMFNDGSRSIDADEEFAYYLPANSSSVRRFRKADQSEDDDFELRNGEGPDGGAAPISEILVLDSRKQSVREDHPCAVKNGGCQQFCFAAPKNGQLTRLCKCAKSHKLYDDGVSCVDRRY